MNNLKPIIIAIAFAFLLLAVQPTSQALGLEPEPLDIIDNTDWIED
jgi:hypothetical protein